MASASPNRSIAPADPGALPGRPVGQPLNLVPGGLPRALQFVKLLHVQPNLRPGLEPVTEALGIVEQLQAGNPAAAAKIGRRILGAVEIPDVHRFAGKPDRSPDTRELGMTRYPYLTVHSIEAGTTGSEGHRIAVLHEAMLWPPEDRPTD
jgi:plasmid stabilization system protein ParE